MRQRSDALVASLTLSGDSPAAWMMDDTAVTDSSDITGRPGEIDVCNVV